jgi:hypothetical protein
VYKAQNAFFFIIAAVTDLYGILHTDKKIYITAENIYNDEEPDAPTTELEATAS